MESEAKTEASRSEALDEAHEFRLGGPGVLGIPTPPVRDMERPPLILVDLQNSTCLNPHPGLHMELHMELRIELHFELQMELQMELHMELHMRLHI